MDAFLAQLSALAANPSLLSAEQRVRMQAFLDEVVPIRGVIAWLIATTAPVFTCVNPDITDEHFPCTEPSIEGAELEDYGRNVSSDFVREDLKGRGRRAMTPAEIFLYWQTSPECRKHWLVALGQEWNGQVVVLHEGADGGSAYLDPVAGGWRAGYCFPSLPL